MITGDGPKIITHVLKDIDEMLHMQYFKTFTTLGKIFELMTVARFLSDDEITELEKLCKMFGQIYTEYFVENEHTIFNKVY